MYARDAAVSRFHIIDRGATHPRRRVVTRQGFLAAYEAEDIRRALYPADTFQVAFKKRDGSWRFEGKDGWPSA